MMQPSYSPADRPVNDRLVSRVGLAGLLLPPLVQIDPAGDYRGYRQPDDSPQQPVDAAGFCRRGRVVGGMAVGSGAGVAVGSAMAVAVAAGDTGAAELLEA